VDGILEAVARHFFIVILSGAVLGAMIIHGVIRVLITASVERSRREIAAYVSEGSITPDQGERLLRARIETPSRT
jgi:hypothetical protein